MTAVAIRETVLTLLDKGVLLEMAWDDLVRFEADEYELGENLEALYELEYKYSMLRTKSFAGVPQRRENMLERLEAVAYNLAETIAQQVLEVFNEWLDGHAIGDAAEWSDARVRELEEKEYGEIVTGDELASGIQTAWQEFDRYAYYKGKGAPFSPYQTGPRVRGPDDSEVVQAMREGKLPSLQVVAETLMKEENEQNADEENFEPYDDSVDFLEGSLDGFGSLHALVEGLDWHYIEASSAELLRELYRAFVFPVWWAYWEPRGIVKARKRVEEATGTLEAIESNARQFPVQQLFGRMNEIVNVAHQTGGMVDHLEERYKIDAAFLQELSERDTSDWDEELTEIGVKLDG